MKDEFKGFYSLENKELTDLWKNAFFVFDTNVLLNLYRYQESTTEQLVRVIKQLKDRVWVPYHVALEYQRNRLKVIASQNAKFSEVKKVIEKGTSSLKGELDNLNLKKRHSSIEPESFINDLNEAAKKFLDELERLEKNHFSVINEDQIRVSLDSILQGCIGSKPVDQSTINDLEKKAEERYKKKVPPGYMDDDKENSDDPIFSYGNLTYQRKYSDYIIWSQIITFAKDKKLSDLIFITDDNKEDWWLKVKQNGEKTISPRPELIGEIVEETGIQRFHMYNSENFLKYANKALSAGVPIEAIEEVRDIARIRDENRDHSLLRKMAHSAEQAVYKWLLDQYGEAHLLPSRQSQVDFIFKIDGRTVGFDIKTIRDPKYIMNRLRNLSHNHYYFTMKNNIDEMTYVLVVFDVEHVEAIKSILERKSFDIPITNFIIGIADINENTGLASDFVPHYQIATANS